MRRFACPYTCDGITHTAMIEASSAKEAADKMNRLPRAPGSGPVGKPFPEGTLAPDAGQQAVKGDPVSAFIVPTLILVIMAICIATPFLSVWVTSP
jgi:hypothetical protein